MIVSHIADNGDHSKHPNTSSSSSNLNIQPSRRESQLLIQTFVCVPLVVVAYRRASSGPYTLSVRCLQIIPRCSGDCAIRSNYMQCCASFSSIRSSCCRWAHRRRARAAEKRREQGKKLQEVAAKARLEKVRSSSILYCIGVYEGGAATSSLFRRRMTCNT